MNKVCLVGRIANDIELRVTTSGVKCVSTSIAINNGKDKEGNERKADFPKVVVYNEQAENLSKYQKKGSLIGVDGRIKTHSWEDKDGNKKYETYVVADRVEFLQSKPKEEVPIPEPDYLPRNEENNNEKDDIENEPYADFSTNTDLSGISDADLPFGD